MCKCGTVCVCYDNTLTSTSGLFRMSSTLARSPLAAAFTSSSLMSPESCVSKSFLRSWDRRSAGIEGLSVNTAIVSHRVHHDWWEMDWCMSVVDCEHYWNIGHFLLLANQLMPRYVEIRAVRYNEVELKSEAEQRHSLTKSPQIILKLQLFPNRAFQVFWWKSQDILQKNKTSQCQSFPILCSPNWNE